MAKDLGYVLKGHVLGDANAALGIIHRKGLGKTRHIDTSYLWVQQVVAEKRLRFAKILGKDNPADLYTKYLDNMTMDKHVAKLDCKYTGGRASTAPQLHMLSRSWIEYIQQQESHELHRLEKISMDIQGHANGTNNRTSKGSQGYLMRIKSTRERDANEERKFMAMQ